MTYDSKSIRVLEGLVAVRLRPGMYIGSTGPKGLHHLVNEIIDNSIDEYLAGYCNKIEVYMEKDGSITVCDNGRGIPVDMHEKGLPAIRVILTTLHSGGKFDNDSYHVSGGLHGVGSSVVNALSKRFTATVYMKGETYREEYADGGNPQTELVKGELPSIGRTSKKGTTINFMPDDTIFETVEFKPEIIRKRIKELSYLNKGLKLIFENKRDGEEKEEFYSDEGLKGLLDEINKNKEMAVKEVIHFSSKKDKIDVEVAISFTRDFSENIISFCNNINTIEGGNHVSGLKASYTRIINQYARELGILKDKDVNFEGRDVRSGMTALISIKHPNPQYEGQTKTKLGNTDARSIVDEVTAIELTNYFDRNLETLKSVIDIAQKSAKLRTAEEKLRGNLLGKGMSLQVNGKLAHCKTKKASEAELFIVEGDSAGGSAKQGRDRNFQAILPLKGKVLNVEKQNIVNVLKNTEITTLISTLGCGFGEGLGDDFDIKKLRYDKVVILTDADVDGSHIRTLLLTFFFRYMPELIYEGKIYIGMPPLFKVTHGKNMEYVYTDKELEDLMKKIKVNVALQRYKGLGEMNPEQLWGTTLDPKTRMLKQVTIDDAMYADEVTTMLMGTKVPPRREFIESEALLAEIDI